MIAVSMPSGAGSTTPILVAASSPMMRAGMMNDAMMITVVNRTEKMKPRLRPRSNTSRRATSQMLRARLIVVPPLVREPARRRPP